MPALTGAGTWRANLERVMEQDNWYLHCAMRLGSGYSKQEQLRAALEWRRRHPDIHSRSGWMRDAGRRAVEITDGLGLNQGALL